MGNIYKDFIDTLSAGFAQYSYNVTPEQIEKLLLFNNMVMETNKHTNLTAIEDGAESAKKHFLDSLNPVAMDIIKSAKSVIDVGSGAGFPGIPLALMNETVHFTLVDTRKKRCYFMQEAADALNLKNVTVVWSRAEDMGKDQKYREFFDVACARALAAMPTLLEYLVPFVKVDGCTMLYKGGCANEEIAAAKNAIETLGMDNLEILPYTVLDETSQYSMVYGNKIRSTPLKYPRKAGMPTKRPL